jgi:dTDP-4-dehydrorhamnose 3,5-epimerase
MGTQSSCAAHGGRSTTWSSTSAGAHPPTHGEWEGFNLNEDGLRQLYCPIGFAHGFCVVSDEADVLYKVCSYYDSELERGIAYDDPDVGIEWPAGLDLIVSERDASAPRLAEIADELPFTY